MGLKTMAIPRSYLPQVSKDFNPTESTYSAAMTCCRGAEQWEIALHLNEETHGKHMGNSWETHGKLMGNPLKMEVFNGFYRKITDFYGPFSSSDFWLMTIIIQYLCRYSWIIMDNSGL